MMKNVHTPSDPTIEALLSLGDAIDAARCEVATAIALALADYGRCTIVSPLTDESAPRSGWSDKSLTMRRRPW